MNRVLPKYLLFTESRLDPFSTDEMLSGVWRFVLRNQDRTSKFEAFDREIGLTQERLALLAVIRGLEALEQPSEVTLITPSRYVRHGFRRGMEAWIENDWMWERFGEFEPVRNHDLWKRIHDTFEFHQVECRIWRVDQKTISDVHSSSPRRPNFKRKRHALASNEIGDSNADQSTSVEQPIVTATRVSTEEQKNQAISEIVGSITNKVSTLITTTC